MELDTLSKIKKELSDKNKIKFKLYSLEYEIVKQDNKYVIYSTLYGNKKESFDSLDRLLNYYTIYNESIIDNIERVIYYE